MSFFSQVGFGNKFVSLEVIDFCAPSCLISCRCPSTKWPVWADRNQTGGDRLVEEGAKTLNNLAGKIDSDKMNNPSFLMVLTANGRYAYRRKDGIYVVPIGCLGK